MDSKTLRQAFYFNRMRTMEVQGKMVSDQTLATFTVPQYYHYATHNFLEEYNMYVLDDHESGSF